MLDKLFLIKSYHTIYFLILQGTESNMISRLGRKG